MTVQNIQCLFVYKKEADNTKVQNKKKTCFREEKNNFSPLKKSSHLVNQVETLQLCTPDWGQDTGDS